MKKKIVLLTFIAIFVQLKAEEIRRVDVPSLSNFTPFHDFRLGIGAVLFENFEMSDSYYNQTINDKIIDFNAITYYRGMVYTNGIFSANYTYQVNPLIGFGLTASYASFYNKILDAETDVIIGSGIRNRFCMYPQIRLTWLKIRNAKFYSEAGLGLGFTMDTENINGTETNFLNRFISGQFTLLGISYGKNLYFYSNIVGVGNSGYVGFGLGYNFNVKK
jgi:hypothetical protein